MRGFRCGRRPLWQFEKRNRWCDEIGFHLSISRRFTCWMPDQTLRALKSSGGLHEPEWCECEWQSISSLAITRQVNIYLPHCITNVRGWRIIALVRLFHKVCTEETGLSPRSQESPFAWILTASYLDVPLTLLCVPSMPTFSTCV